MFPQLLLTGIDHIDEILLDMRHLRQSLLLYLLLQGSTFLCLLQDSVLLLLQPLLLI